MGFHYQSPFSPVEAFFPPWVQIILFGFVGFVLMDWAMERLSEHRGLVRFLIYLTTAVVFSCRAAALLVIYFAPSLPESVHLPY
jgi:hypothetical protein